MHVNIDYNSIDRFLRKNAEYLISPGEGSTFEQELFAMQTWEGWDDQVYIHRQILLPKDENKAILELNRHLDSFLDGGAEGIILRDSNSMWVPKRVNNILKFKPWSDDEGTIVGFTSGRETDKGSKFRGMIGALILDYKGKRLELSGLTNKEREFENEQDSEIAFKNPGTDMPKGTQGKHFKVGDTVTFKYRELSDDGVPKEARYWRSHEVE